MGLTELGEQQLTDDFDYVYKHIWECRREQTSTAATLRVSDLCRWCLAVPWECRACRIRCWLAHFQLPVLLVATSSHARRHLPRNGTLALRAFDNIRVSISITSSSACKIVILLHFSIHQYLSVMIIPSVFSCDVLWPRVHTSLDEMAMVVVSVLCNFLQSSLLTALYHPHFHLDAALFSHSHSLYICHCVCLFIILPCSKRLWKCII